MVLQIIIKYWVQWLCGIVAIGIAAWARRYIKLEKKQMAEKQKERMEELRTEVKDEITKELHENVEELREEDRKLHEEISTLNDSMTSMSAGILSIQGGDFKRSCRTLLQEDHRITLDEYEQLVDDHDVYNLLGGNHKGDELFKLVQAKYEHQLQ